MSDSPLHPDHKHEFSYYILKPEHIGEGERRDLIRCRICKVLLDDLIEEIITFIDNSIPHQTCECKICECENLIDDAAWCCTYCAEVHHKFPMVKKKIS